MQNLESDNSARALREQVSRGLEYLKRGRCADAAAICDLLLATDDGNAEVLYLAYEVRLAEGRAEAALALLESAIYKAGHDPLLLTKKARLLVALRRRDEARRAAEAAVAVAGDDARILWQIGRVYADCNDPLRAADLYERALARDRGNRRLQYDLAASRFFIGDFDSAETTLDALVADAPQMGHAYYLRATLRRQTTSRNHVVELDARLKHGFAKPAEHISCLYALAKELEDLGEDERSFAVLTEGAARKRETLTYDADVERQAIENVRAAFTAESAADARAGHDETGAIFIVGMPRSGTTLVERLLCRHSKVKSAGELMDFRQMLASASRAAQVANHSSTVAQASLTLDFAALGREYLRAARQAAHGSRIFVDKMPANFLYCGHIHQALPNARIIHLVRDPMDSCYAMYKTLFNQAYFFSYDLVELAEHFATYRQLMRHWHAVLPNAILDVHYENLVTHFEREARRVIDWCRLDWQNAVLDPAYDDQPVITASAAQVRDPVHTDSVKKWRRFAKGLAPLQTQLAAAGVVCAE